MTKARKKIKLKSSKSKAVESQKDHFNKLERIKNIIPVNVEYNKVKYKDTIYTVGDSLLIKDSTEGYLIGKLTKIHTTNGLKKYIYWPTIEVEWYYKKTDINREKNNLTEDEKYDSISDFEVFRSNHKDIIFIETILAICQVYSFEEYETQVQHSTTTFFCRANYDPVNQLLNPPIDSWEKSCICNYPLNPDQLYIKCDSCEKWYHPKHCGLTDEEVETLKEFFCIRCKKN